jgi:hypothetical protein
VAEVLAVDAVELVEAVEVAVEGITELSSVVSADCAPEMLLFDRAVETLERNVLRGLVESELVLEDESFCTSARYFLASEMSPELIDDMRLVSALSKVLWLLLEVDEVDEVDNWDNSFKRELLLCKLEINISRSSHRFLKHLTRGQGWLGYTGGLRLRERDEGRDEMRDGGIPVWRRG